MSDTTDETLSFEQKITPILEKFEVQRKQCIKKWTISMFVIGGLCAVGCLFISQSSAQGFQPFLIAIFVSGLLGAGSFYLITRSYKKGFKDEVVTAVVRAYQADFEYHPRSYVSKSKFRESKLFLKGIDRYKGEDHISGTCGKTDFEFSELHAEYKTTTSNGKGRTSTQWHTIFKGIFFIADFHKDFRTHTVVLPDTAEKLFGFLGKKLQEMNFTRGELIKLEDPEFEREFCVYGDDQIEARYILSPGLMRRILSYRSKFGAKMYLAFLHSKVYIALGTDKNHFEPKVFKPANDLSQVQEFRNDLDMIIDIIEDLNLNARLWSKE